MKFLRQNILRRILHLIWVIGISESHDIIMESKFQKIRKDSGNPLLQGPYHPGFSQTDEDSIIQEIVNRVDKFQQNSGAREFVELGVGDGTQNNTLALLINGWNGLWFGGQDIVVKFTTRLKFNKIWITLESLREKVIPAILKIENLKLLSCDLDGNDYWIAKDLLAHNIRPDIWVQEYNSLFLPHIKWTIPYYDNHVYKYDGYYGASLGAFVELFESNGYFLVACSVNGANAFFVKEKFRDEFLDISSDTNQLYMPNRPWLHKSRNKMSHRITLGIDPTKSLS